MAPEPNRSGRNPEGYMDREGEINTNGDPDTDRPAAPATRGPQVTAITIADESDSWRAAGFNVGTDDVCGLGSVAIHLAGGPGGFISWSFDELRDGVSDIDGVVTASRPERHDATHVTHMRHPNGITSIDHLVISSDDCDRTTAALEAAGFPKRRGRTMTSKGSPMAQGFFWAGDVILELVGPDSGESATEEADSTTNEPAELFGLALVSPDLDATARFLGELMGQPKDAVQAGRRIAGLRGRSVGISVPIAVMSPHPA